MMMQKARTPLTPCCGKKLYRRGLAYASYVGLLVLAGACGGRHKSAPIEEVSEAVAASPSQTAQPVSKGKTTAALRERPPGLIYRQAGEQARQRLNAENAHLRLDELDAQIEHEKEISR